MFQLAKNCVLCSQPFFWVKKHYNQFLWHKNIEKSLILNVNLCIQHFLTLWGQRTVTSGMSTSIAIFLVTLSDRLLVNEINKQIKQACLVFNLLFHLAKEKPPFGHAREGIIHILAACICKRTLYFCDYIFRVISDQVENKCTDKLWLSNLHSILWTAAQTFTWRSLLERFLLWHYLLEANMLMK